jgi:hypothetical protein
MTRRSVLSIFVPLVFLVGFGATASAASTDQGSVIHTKTTDVCLLVWNGPNAPGRDGYCVRLPNLPN